MSSVANVLLSVALATQAATTVRALRAMADVEGGSEALVAAARGQPDTLRLALERTFALSTRATTDAARAEELSIARRLAAAYDVAWNDPFFVRLVASFETWSLEERRAKVQADSLRRAGREALGAAGLSTASALWGQALERVPAVDRSGQADSWLTVGAAFFYAGQLDSATVYLDRSRDLARSVGDVRTWGNAVGILASVRKDRGDRAGAAELYAEASVLRERSGDERGIAADQSNLGLIALELGDLQEARRAFGEALEVNLEAGRSRPAAINLTNLADVASLAGEYGRAEELYREALATNQADGDRAEMAYPLHDLGRLAMRRGDYAGARATLEQALAIHDESGATLEAIDVRIDLVALHTATGNLEAALGALRDAEEGAAVVPEAHGLHASLALARADLAVQLGRLAEADLDYARAEQRFRAAADYAGRGEAQQGRGLLLSLREDYAGALEALNLAVGTQTRSGDQRSAFLTRLLIGYVQSEAGDTAGARATLTGARERLHTLDDVVGEAAALIGLGDLAAQTGAVLASEALYHDGLERLGDVPAADVRWRLHFGLGNTLRNRGALAAAAAQYEAAIATLEDVAGGMRIEERRVGYLGDKWETYAALALLEQRRGRADEAFGISERLRARQLGDMLARGRIPSRSEVSEREQDLRRRITELTRTIESAASDRTSLREPELTLASVDAAREALASSQDAYEALLLELRESDPAYAELVSGEPVAWREVASRLSPHEALLEYLVTDSSSTVFVVTSDTLAAIDLDVGRPLLANLVEFVRRSMAMPGRSPASSLWRTPLRRLHDYLIEPAERSGLLESKRSLVIVPHGELHFLPFAALLDDAAPTRFLVERYELSRAPSATAWVRLAERMQDDPGDGVLALAPSVESLPASREEVVGIREVYGRETVILMGASASEAALRDAAAGHSILHLATYGVLNKHNPLFSFVELAPGTDDDGRLEVHEVFGLRLTGQLVVLSACQTAVASGAISDVPPGDDWVGLVQAFLYAGARGVVASLWPVEDAATARLMQRFYQQLAEGETEAGALAEAQRALIRDPRTAHPFFWAGFVRNGAGS